MSTKQVIVINRGTTPPMRRGKEVAQGAHASMAWLTLRLKPGLRNTSFEWLRVTDAEKEWLAGGHRKITCQVSTTAELVRLHRAAQEAGLEAHLVTDAGLTEFGGLPTVTALAIGPDYDEKIDAVTGDLKLY